MTYYPSEAEITRYRHQCQMEIHDMLTHYAKCGGRWRDYTEEVCCANLQSAVNYAADHSHPAEMRLFALRSALDNARLGITE